jgi:small-conductance mechanosensitive channel
MQQSIDALTSNYWHLLLGALVVFLSWRIGARVVGERPLADHFPRFTAALDVLILPLFCIVGGGLVRVANAEFGVAEFDWALSQLTLLLACLAAGWALARLIDVSLSLNAEEQLGQRVPKLIIGLIYAALLFLGLTAFLWQQGYSFAGVWVSTGVAAAVLGLALQRTLGDLFSGIALGLERPFLIGDWVELKDGTIGQVVDLNWRATHLRGWDNATHVIPNSRMAGESIKNLHAETHLFGPWYFVKIPAEVDPRFATALLLDAAMRCESVLKVPNPIVRLADASSVPYSYMVWVHLKNYPTVFRGREELFREIHRSLQEAGIEVAPQIQELRTRRARVANAELPTIALTLKSLDFADTLTEAELAQIAARSEYRYFNGGHVLLAEGAASDAVYVVAGGLVHASIRLPNGARKVVDTLVPGKHFGMTEMLSLEPGFLEFVANTDVTLIRIDLECVRAIVDARPELAEMLTRVIKERLDAAEAARVASRQPAKRLTLRDIRLGVERRIRGPNRPNR